MRQTLLLRYCLRTLLLWGICSCSNCTEAAVLSYSFTRVDSSSVLVSLTFTGNKSGITKLLLPKQWASQDNLYTAVTNLQALSKHTTLTATDTAWQYTVKHRPGAKVVISYILHKDWPGALRYPLYFRPVIEKDFVYFEGYSALVYPDIEDTVPVKCLLSFAGFPSGAFTGNSFFAGRPSGTFIATLAQLRNAIYCYGQYHDTTVLVHGNPVVIAIHGNFPFTDGQVYNAVSGIITAERDFWQDQQFPYFFISLHAMEGNNSSGGTGHYQSFTMFQSTDMPFTRDLTWLISHENFHTWLGERLKMPEPEELTKWFSEGFTDYYAYKIQKQVGILTAQGFVDKINGIIKAYYLSPVFSTPNTAIIGRYWSDGNLKQLSYQRGLVQAFLLDNSISRQGASLDDLMRALYKSSSPAYIFSKALFDSLLLQYAGQPVLAVIDSVNAGNNGPLAQAFAGIKGYSVRIDTVDKVFDIGLNINQSMQEHKVIGLEAGSNAEKAGLFEGEPLAGGVSIYMGDVTKPARIQVLKDGQKQWVVYLPVKGMHIEIPQVMLLMKE